MQNPNLKARIDKSTNTMIREQTGSSVPHNRRQNQQNPHHHRILRYRIRLLQPTSSNCSHRLSDSILSPGSLLVEYPQSEYLQHRGQRHAGGGRRNIVALYHIQERRQV